MTSANRSTSLRARLKGPVGLAALGVTLGACSAILGIEDIHDGPRDGSAGDAGSSAGNAISAGKSGGGASGAPAGGSAGRGGSVASGGRGVGGSGGASGGASGASGATGGKAGSGVSGGTGGDMSTGGDANSGGDSGTGNTPGGSVHGKVIDVWRHPVPQVPVAIGATTVMTNASGEFTIDDVPGTYDASLFVSWENGEFGYVYRGLTLREPTLQVHQAFATNETTFSFLPGTAAWDEDDAAWRVSFGGPDGSHCYRPDDGGQQVRQVWEGPDSTDWTIHSLFFDRTAGVPSAYSHYETRMVHSAIGDDYTYLDFDLTSHPVTASGYVSGSVSWTSEPARHLSVFLQFPSGAALPVVDAVPVMTPNYQYLVPDVNGSITVAATEGDPNGAYMIVHRGGLAVGSTAPALQMLAAPIATDPAGGTFAGTVDSNIGAYVAFLREQGRSHGIYVITSTPFTLADIPVVQGDFKLNPGEGHLFWIQTHGGPANVDAMVGPDGFIDDFALQANCPSGPFGDGSFGESLSLDFTTPP